jgi:hypothetical protein
MGSSILIYHKDSSHENWQKMLDETEYLTLNQEDYNIWDLLFDTVLLTISDKLISYIKDKYYEEYPGKADMVTTWLKQHKGRVLYHHTWTF